MGRVALCMRVGQGAHSEHPGGPQPGWSPHRKPELRDSAWAGSESSPGGVHPSSAVCPRTTHFTSLSLGEPGLTQPSPKWLDEIGGGWAQSQHWARQQLLGGALRSPDSQAKALSLMCWGGSRPAPPPHPPGVGISLQPTLPASVPHLLLRGSVNVL